MNIERHQVIASDGTRLAAYSAGGGDGVPLVLANGLGGNIDAWAYFIDTFASRHRIVSWDYRGLHGSERPGRGDDYSVATQTDDMVTVMDALGVAQAVVVGWSMGVQVNFELVRRRPDRVLGIVAINGTFGRPFETAFGPVLGKLVVATPALMRLAQIGTPLVSEGLQQVMPLVARTPFFLHVVRRLGLVGATVDERVFSELASAVAGLDLSVYMSTLNSLGDHCAEAVLPTINVPVLVVAGDRDLFTPANQSQKMVQLVPSAELLVIPSGTHYTPIEFPELIHRRVTGFLERFAAGEPSEDAASTNAASDDNDGDDNDNDSDGESATPQPAAAAAKKAAPAKKKAAPTKKKAPAAKKAAPAKKKAAPAKKKAAPTKRKAPAAKKAAPAKKRTGKRARPATSDD